MNKFKLIERIEQYKYEAIAVIGLLGVIFINNHDPLSKLSAIIMLFGMFGMLAKTISPTVNVMTVDVEQVIKMIERNEGKGK